MYRKMMIFYIYHIDIQFMIFVTSFLIGDCYDLKCPVRSQRQQRSNYLCNISEAEYMCLQDVITFQHIELCAKKGHFQRPGYKIVWSGNFDGQTCENQRYQPIKFINRDGSDCIFQKSVCNEEGQILVEDGSPIRDRRCRCDYRRGYAFVSDLPNRCTCIPSIEDCSCYLKHCPKFHQLSPDYKCIWQDEIHESTSCTRLLDGNVDNKEKKRSTLTKCAPFNSAELVSNKQVYKEPNCTIYIHTMMMCLVILNGIAVIGFYVLTKNARFQGKRNSSDNDVLARNCTCKNSKLEKLNTENKCHQRNTTTDYTTQSTSTDILNLLKDKDQLVKNNFNEHDEHDVRTYRIVFVVLSVESRKQGHRIGIDNKFKTLYQYLVSNISQH